MRVSIAAIFAAGLVLTQGAPVDPNATIYLTSDAEKAITGQSPNPKVVFSMLAANNMVNDCGYYTFINQSSGGSPLISDCQQITRNIANGGSWEVEDFGGQHQLIQYGTCAFGVTGDKSINGFYIGNPDIIDLINSSIGLFAWERLVGAKGVMGCQSLTGLVGGVTVTWGLYHT
ncbi:putative necrosis-inducing factor-domain-containing protein [Penicillium subrubescens]|uniref:Ecp2 effector protein-like domain-containing protein n=1 Tax=Penicillium subrubescens TaxID=1316194 RepID=A0A1Q5T9V2_9EURO|nr:putative necrosis-inducing factor-domain-containing protein [Penicillium subrubescens]KAJ5900892.1 putative necrosis-inducing factor-domain-containing protein [Penicillium subrubescens]OKO96961.1 hypothetical protein PENSUB_10515 [Penicillium subrubescens]